MGSRRVMTLANWIRCAFLGAIGVTLVMAQDRADAGDEAKFLQQWCVSCHSGAKPEGQLDLATFPKDATAARAKVAKRLRAGSMPPPKAPQPPRDQIAAMLWLCEEGDAASRPSAGRVTIRRLSRYEYRNTIRDLLGVEAPADDFPVDDVGYGFDNVGDVLSVSPLLLEKYAAAAEKIALEVILAEDPDRPPKVRVDGKSMVSSVADSFRGTSRVLFKNGQASLGVYAPRTGEFRVRVGAHGDQAGPDKVRMIIGAAGTSQRAEVEVAATKADPGDYEGRLDLPKGEHKIGVAFINDYYDPKDGNPNGHDRNLVIDWIEVIGPVDRIEPPAAHRAIFAADPGGSNVGARLRAILRPLLLRAWRRPAANDEVGRLADLAAITIADGARFERGVQLALQAILTSPHFLFRAEVDPPGVRTAERDLNGFEIASRLSYFLWSSLPDATLLDLAAKDALRDPARLEQEVRRMLADAKASALAENFACQWLEIRNLADAAPDPAAFPGFDEDLRDAMRRETEMLFDAVLREGRPVHDLIAADFTFVNERLARHYGIPGVRGSHFRRVVAPADRGGGVLAHASILTITSNATRTSPVRRGKFVLDNLLDAPPAPPPPGVGALDERPEAVKAATIRERMERHRTDPSCASCHTRIDSLGFAFESYDPIGAWRARDEGAAVDSAATLPDGRAINGLEGLKKVIREDGTLVPSIAKKLFVYAVGRGLEPSDERAIRTMIAALRGPDPSIAEIIVGIVNLDAFRRRAP